MSSIGIDKDTFLPIVGWDHTRQSIVKILMTELGERILRRAFGSLLPTMIDRPQNESVLLQLYTSIAEALYHRRSKDGYVLGEPRYHLTAIVFKANPSGVLELELSGIYYPNGHKGDFTPDASPKTLSIPLASIIR